MRYLIDDRVNTEGYGAYAEGVPEEQILRRKQLIHRVRRDCIIKMAILIVLALACGVFLPLSGKLVYAAENVPVKMEIPLRYIAEEDVTGEFHLTAEDPAAPMPAGSVDGDFSLVLSGPADTSFGTITYERPGVYEYTARSDADPAVYQIRIIAANDGQGSMIVRKNGEEGKAELVFRSQADGGGEEPENPAEPEDEVEESLDRTAAEQPESGQGGETSPRTGDRMPVVLWLALYILSGIGMLVLLIAGGLPRRASLCIIALMIVAAGAVLLPQQIHAAQAPKSLKITYHHKGTCDKCGDKRGDGRNDWKTLVLDNQGSAYHWVEYKDPITGKNTKTDAYCMVPKKQSPAPKDYTAKYMNPEDSSGRAKRLSRVLYFGYDAPGYSALKKHVEAHPKKYKKFVNDKGNISGKNMYQLLHYVISYAYYNGYDGFPSIITSESKKEIKAVYEWCAKNAVLVDDASFVLEAGARGSGRTTANATYSTSGSDSGKYVSEKFIMTAGSSNQYVNIPVPKYGQIRLIANGKETKYTTEGQKVTIRPGYQFYFVFDGKRADNVSSTIKGVMTAFYPYTFQTTDKEQTMGFCATTDEDVAKIVVKLVRPASGGVKIQKRKVSMDGTKTPEANVKFQVWEASYATYEAAAGASTDVSCYAATVITDSEGTGMAEGLTASSAGTRYLVKQITSSAGYSDMANNPVSVTIRADETVVLDGSADGGDPDGDGSYDGWIDDTEIGIRIKILKIDQDTGELIVTPATRFGVYKQDGSLAYAGADSLWTAVSGSEAGTVTTQPLAPGKYYVEEITPPSGYANPVPRELITLAYNSNTKVSDTEYVYKYKKRDPKNEHHNVVLNKAIGEGSAVDTFTFDVALSNIKAEDNVSVISKKNGSASEQVHPVSIADGSIAISGIPIQAGGQIRITNLPVGAKYRITERGNASYRPSFTAAPVRVVGTRADSGEKGQPLSVEETVLSAKEAKLEDAAYVIHYDWVNDKSIRHSLLVEKESIGMERDIDDAFEFEVELGNGTLAEAVEYMVYDTDENGKKHVTEQGASSGRITARLRDGSRLKVTNILPGTTYRITEMASEYTPSYTSNIGEEGSGAGKSDLRTPVLAMPDSSADAQVEFRFVNQARPSDGHNQLYVTKKLSTEDASKNFDYVAAFEGLEPGGWYTVAREGTRAYTLTEENGLVTVKNDSNAPVPGVPVTLTRSDGKSRTIMTNGSGIADLTETYLAKWILKKGAECELSWYGGSETLTVADASDSGNGEDPGSGNTGSGNGEDPGNGDTGSEDENELTDPQAIPEEPEERIWTSVNSVLENALLTTFAADGEGKGSVGFTLCHGQYAQISGLPENAAYTVTELANKYEPSYKVYRTQNGATREIDRGDGGTRSDLPTAQQFFPEGTVSSDRMDFVNKESTETLKITKTLENGGTKTFPFRAVFEGLSEPSYYAVVPGNATWRIASDETGEITVTIRDSSYFAGNGGDYSGLPVKIIRSDGEERTLYTNAQGKISRDTYVNWLTQVADDHTYTIEFLMDTFTAQW